MDMTAQWLDVSFFFETRLLANVFTLIHVRTRPERGMEMSINAALRNEKIKGKDVEARGVLGTLVKQ